MILGLIKNLKSIFNSYKKIIKLLVNVHYVIKSTYLYPYNIFQIHVYNMRKKNMYCQCKLILHRK